VSDQRFARLFELGDFGVVELSADGEIVDANPAAARLLGAEAASLRGRPFGQLVCDVYSEHAASVLSAPAPGEGLLRLELCFERSDGQHVWGDTSCVRIDETIALLIADVTARRRAETAQRESETRFRALFDAASDLALVHDLDGQIVDANRYACSALGYLKGELIGQSIRAIATAAEPERWPNLEPGVPTTISDRYRKDDGTFIDVEVRLSVFDRHGARMVMALARDVGDRIRLEEARAQFVDRVVSAQEDERRRIARELHDALGQLLTGLSVQIRSVEELASAGDVAERLADVRALSERIIGEVENLAHQLRPPALDELGFVAAVEGHVGTFAKTHGIDVALHVGSLSRRLPSEVEVALYRIVQEGLTNIARHSGAKSVSILVDERPNAVRLVVEDDGRGFDTASVDTAQRLGVSGIHERAALLGGSASVESSPGGGTAVYVTLPLTDS